MEDVYKEKIEMGYQFLMSPEAKVNFADADYHLRNGMHIQRECPRPEAIFRFVDKYSNELEQYYSNLLKVQLMHGGEEWNRYFYLDFNEGSRGNIAQENREYLPIQTVIIGLLVINAYKIDAHVEINSISEFKRVLQEDYSEYKSDLYRLLANTESTKGSDHSDGKIDSVIDAAFKSFAKLGWVLMLKEDEFKFMPAFERLRKMYENQINSVEDIFKTPDTDNELPEDL